MSKSAKYAAVAAHNIFLGIDHEGDECGNTGLLVHVTVCYLGFSLTCMDERVFLRVEHSFVLCSVH